MLLLAFLTFIYCLKIIVYCFLLLRKEKPARPAVADIGTLPTVDILVPMYNEENAAVKTIRNLLEITYPHFGIIVIDDGSSDETLALVNRHFEHHPQVKILHQENRGKSAALNNGMLVSQSDIVLCVDADTLVKPDLIDKMVPHFCDEKIAAVAGNIKVGNRRNLITNMQYVEYITNGNFERVVFEPVNGILVIPGAIGAFRRADILQIGGFTADTLTEDNELSLRILCQGYKVSNEPEAVGFTEAPQHLKMLLKQRVRWKVGTVQVFNKFRKQAFSSPNKWLRYVVMPYSLLFTLILPVITPLADFCLLYDIIFREGSLFPFYLAFILVDFLIGSCILIKNKEPFSLILFLPLQRLLLRQVVFLVYLNVLLKYFKGGLFEWDKIAKLGNVEVD